LGFYSIKIQRRALYYSKLWVCIVKYNIFYIFSRMIWRRLLQNKYSVKKKLYLNKSKENSDQFFFGKIGSYSIHDRNFVLDALNKRLHSLYI